MIKRNEFKMPKAFLCETIRNTLKMYVHILNVQGLANEKIRNNMK